MTLDDLEWPNVTLAEKNRFDIWFKFPVHVTCDTSQLILGSGAQEKSFCRDHSGIAGELCSVYNRSCVECSLTVLIVERGGGEGERRR